MSNPLSIYRPSLAVGRDAQVLHRAASREFSGWLEHTRTAGGCSRPIRLTGTIAAVDRNTGRITGQMHTDELPDQTLYKACGNRRESVCPDCAWVYQGDAYQVVCRGLTGGKGVPDSVAGHPVVFATFTAPSFGPVHRRPVPRHTCRNRQRCDCRPAPCRARSNAGTCPHGQPTSCFARHNADDPRLGQPLCLDCYDHAHQVVWNYFSGELWRRTKQAIDRHLAATCHQRDIPKVGIITASGKVRWVPPVRVSHGKVAEMQRRAAVHFHVLLRLDGVDPDDPDALVPPPAGITVDDLEAAVHAAVRQITVTTPPHPDRPQGWLIAWGEQVDVRRINTASGELTDGKVAAYLAKYATKATEAAGHSLTRLTRPRSMTTPIRKATTLPASLTPVGTLAASPRPTGAVAPQQPATVKAALTPNRTCTAGCVAGHTCSASAATSSPKLGATPSPSACSGTPVPPTAAPRTTNPLTRSPSAP